MDAYQVEKINTSGMAVYTATLVLTEVMRRNKISFTEKQIEGLCTGISYRMRADIGLTQHSYKELQEMLFALLTNGVDSEVRKKSGSERTPDEIIEYMLDILGYNTETSMYCSIVDPACGTGTFVNQILKRFLEGRSKNVTAEAVKDMLIKQRLIRAYDTKTENVYITKVVMICRLIKHGFVRTVDDVLEMINDLPVYCADFLHVEEKVDFVVGNPPYIRAQNMSEKYRNFIKENYTCATGRFDIFTCFVENSDKILNEDGKLCLITSDKYLTANYGVGIRKYLYEKGHVRKIIDLYDTKFFGASVLPAILLCENNTADDGDVEYIGIKSSNNVPQYYCGNGHELFEYMESGMSGDKSVVQYGERDVKTFEIARSRVNLPANGSAWSFSSEGDNAIKSKMETQKWCTLKDVMDVCVGIKTTADAVFVEPMTENFIKAREFEEKTIYPLIQSFDISKWRVEWGENPQDRYILYPHREMDGHTVAIPIEEIPRARKYLEEYADLLKSRTYLAKSKKRMWYECWVPQKLSKFRQTKIVTRDIVSHNAFALDESGKLCQGNTFFLTRKPTIFSMQYDSLSEHQYFCFLLGILNSRALEYYQKMISGCLYSHKYRYTTTNLNQWPVPQIELSDARKIAKYVDELIGGTERQEELEKEIDQIVDMQFHLNQEDVLKMKSLIGRCEGVT